MKQILAFLLAATVSSWACSASFFVVAPGSQEATTGENTSVESVRLAPFTFSPVKKDTNFQFDMSTLVTVLGGSKTAQKVAWHLSKGKVPPGLAFKLTGELSGTATEAGVYAFALTASTGNSADEQWYAMTVSDKGEVVITPTEPTPEPTPEPVPTPTPDEVPVSAYMDFITQLLENTKEKDIVSRVGPDFTVEGWVRTSSKSQGKGIISQLAKELDGKDKKTKNYWVHIAFSRASGVTSLYVSGYATSASTFGPSLAAAMQYVLITEDEGKYPNQFAPPSFNQFH